jgi:ABC-type nitrate/sulfonate/bicarbonate transport system substrate-binding protein
VSIVSRLILIMAISAMLVHEGYAKDINFGWPSGEGWSSQPYKVAAEKGFFEKEGLKVRMITFRGTNLMLAALMSGDYICPQSRFLELAFVLLPRPLGED